MWWLIYIKKNPATYVNQQAKAENSALQFKE